MQQATSNILVFGEKKRHTVDRLICCFNIISQTEVKVELEFQYVPWGSTYFRPHTRGIKRRFTFM